jgi:CheY-like chemotaxis protein
MGVAMENMNGFELCEELQKKTTADTKFCFITNFGPYYDILLKEYPELSCYPFITTPITIDELVNKLTEYLELSEKPFIISSITNEKLEEILNEERAKQKTTSLFNE